MENLNELNEKEKEYLKEILKILTDVDIEKIRYLIKEILKSK